MNTDSPPLSFPSTPFFFFFFLFFRSGPSQGSISLLHYVLQKLSYCSQGRAIYYMDCWCFSVHPSVWAFLISVKALRDLPDHCRVLPKSAPEGGSTGEWPLLPASAAELKHMPGPTPDLLASSSALVHGTPQVYSV